MTEQEWLEEFGNLPGPCPCCHGPAENSDSKEVAETEGQADGAPQDND